MKGLKKMQYRIFITGSGISDEAIQILKEENCIFMVGDPGDSPDDLKKKISQFNPDGIIVRQGKISKEIQNAAENLRVICKHGVGTDNIDIEAATKRRIPVMYTPLANYESVAEHTLALALALIRKITTEDRNIRNGVFNKKNYDGLELLGKTWGLIGFGRIGKRLSELISPFNMQILFYDPFYVKKILSKYISRVHQIEELYSETDIISLHCPLTLDTQGIINSKSISKMKENVFIINTARGGLVNEQDLFNALKRNRIRGAALDVFDTEPPSADHPLYALDNIILSTHIAGISDNSFRNMGIAAVRNVMSFLRDNSMDETFLVNKHILTD
jgi:D-3-phosphoglycerate dehydrogenase